MDTVEILGKTYSPRIADYELEKLLKISGGVVIEGPRGCGKTMTAVNRAHSVVFMDDERVQALSELSPAYPLQGHSPHLIDEWQVRPAIWNQVRRSIDKAEGFGHFILTGSANPADDLTRHTGAARLLRMRMSTLTWFEKGFSHPTVSLRDLFDGQSIPTAPARFTLDDNLEALLTSGFPAQSQLGVRAGLRALRGYLREISNVDLGRVVGTRQDPQLIKALLISLARATSTDVSLATLRKDLLPHNPSLSDETVASLVSGLERLFVLESVPAWAVKLRSRARLRRSPKRHLVDPALAAAALGASVESLKGDLETLGLLFESAVAHDLKVLLTLLDGELYHYRDSNGAEIDLIAVLPDGRWGAIEVKLGGGAAKVAAEKLPKLVENIDAPYPASFMAVITAIGPSVTAENGVSTFPLLSLGA